MNKDNLVSNICAIALLIMSLVETIVVGVLCSIKWYVLVLWQFVAIIGVLVVRFAYQIAQIRNMRYSYFCRENSDDFDDEPSDIAVYLIKVFGYFLLFLFAFIYPMHLY